MTRSRYYNLPVLEEYKGLRPGMSVEYVGTMPLPGPHVLEELVSLLDVDNLDSEHVTAILDGGEWECDADNLRPAKE